MCVREREIGRLKWKKLFKLEGFILIDKTWSPRERERERCEKLSNVVVPRSHTKWGYTHHKD